MNRAFLFIMLGATLWGTIGWFVKNLYVFGFTPMEVVTLRVSTTAIIMLLYIIIKSPKKLKLLSFMDIKYFIGTGIVSLYFLTTVCLLRLNYLLSLLHLPCYTQHLHL